MTQPGIRYRLPKSVRIISSDDYGRVLRSDEPGSIRLGRDSVSVCVSTHLKTGRVRFGFTVGKHNVPRSVDRALVKRLMRECVRHALPTIVENCKEHQVGAEISLRMRSSLKSVGSAVSTAQAKAMVRGSVQACLRAVIKRLPAAAKRAHEQVQCPKSS